MQKIKLFLASSNELQTERQQFELKIYRKCKAWFEQNVFLHLDVWEDLSAKMSATRSQDEYNKIIAAADIFVLLVHTKLGMYSAEEFEQAFGSFQTAKKPFIYPYFKETTSADPSLLAFKDKLHKLGHFPVYYNNFDNLWQQFDDELDRLLLNGFRQRPPATHTGGNAPGGGGSTRIINQGPNSTYFENATGVHINNK